MVKIARLAEKYIAEHPSIRDCFISGLINYSALTRKIVDDLGLRKKDFHAVLIACRRYFGRVNKAGMVEKDIIRIIKESKLEVRNKVVDVLVEKGFFFDHLIEIHKEVSKRGEMFNIIEGTKTMTIITSMEFLGFIKKLFKKKVLRVHENLAEVVIKSPEDLTDTPGVIAYLSSLLAGNGVNMIEIMSTHTDTLIVIQEKDIAKVMDVLRV